jgi:hypothetical protein
MNNNSQATDGLRVESRAVPAIDGGMEVVLAGLIWGRRLGFATWPMVAAAARWS